MADYQKAFNFMMDHEDRPRKGTITREPDGGLARFGINSVEHPEAVEDGLYDHFTTEKALQYASDFYKYKFFSPISGYQIADQDVCNKFFDLAVNQGMHQATLCVQRAVNSLGGVLAIDGVPGPHTIASVNACNSAALLGAIKEQAKGFYIELVAKKPALQPYLKPWLARVEA